jgi:hypothetical protein
LGNREVSRTSPACSEKTGSSGNTPAASIITPKSKRGANPAVTLVNTTTIPTEKQECEKRKKKNIDDENASIEDILDDGSISSPANTKAGVSDTDDAITDDNTIFVEDDEAIPT